MGNQIKKVRIDANLIVSATRYMNIPENELELLKENATANIGLDDAIEIHEVDITGFEVIE